ncbi:MAG: ferritin [bacterium]|nr:ferritin [bacterium]
MLASQKIIDAFNVQIGNEMGASNQYVAIASYFSNEDLEQLSQFFFRQADEEREHAMKFVKFILDVDGKVEIPQIEAPRSDFDQAREAVGLSLDWEREVTDQIYRLVELCQEERNHIALRFLDWFVTEQLEEVTTIGSLLGIVERAGENNLLYVEDYLSRHGIEGPESAGPE